MNPLDPPFLLRKRLENVTHYGLVSGESIWLAAESKLIRELAVCYGGVRFSWTPFSVRHVGPKTGSLSYRDHARGNELLLDSRAMTTLNLDTLPLTSMAPDTVPSKGTLIFLGTLPPQVPCSWKEGQCS